MIILGIETSCDETALALIETRGKSPIAINQQLECRVIDSLVHSQAELHSAYGGVYPNLAKREHQKNLPILLDRLLSGSSLSKDKLKIDAIAVTEGPGLEPALWVGIEFARKLGNEWKVPVIPVNHMEGHIVGSLLESDSPMGTWQKLKRFELPAIALLISGGHTELILIRQNSTYQILGQTLDDAAGEAFDKVARLLGLPYPGGPHLSKLSDTAEEKGVEPNTKLPRPMLNSRDCNFSFSGLKTAVLYAVRKAQEQDQFTETYKEGIALEFERSVTEVVESKTKTAIEQTNARALIVGGGVSANSRIRRHLEGLAEKLSIPIFLPSRHVSGDNALMIALVGALHGSSNSAEVMRAQGTMRL